MLKAMCHLLFPILQNYLTIQVHAHLNSEIFVSGPTLTYSAQEAAIDRDSLRCPALAVYR